MRIVYYLLPEFAGESVTVSEVIPLYGEVELSVLLSDTDVGKQLFAIDYDEDNPLMVDPVENQQPFFEENATGFNAVLPFNNINEVDGWVKHYLHKKEELDDHYRRQDALS